MGYRFDFFEGITLWNMGFADRGIVEHSSRDMSGERFTAVHAINGRKSNRSEFANESRIEREGRRVYRARPGYA